MNPTPAKVLECPFTWSICESVIINFDENEMTDEKDVYLPFITMMGHVMKSYILTVKGKFNEAETELQTAYEIWNNIDNKQMEGENISFEVVQHILESTEYYICDRTGKLSNSEVLALYSRIQDSIGFNEPLQKGTINGCKSIAWSIFYEAGMDLAIQYSRLAVKFAATCPTWHYLRGKNLRRRRRANKCLDPIREEIEAFIMSYQLSKNPHYGIYLGQMYKECKQFDKSRKIYLELYKAKPTCSSIQLRLALGFIRMRDFERAKNCLDYVEKVCPDSAMFQHYMGIYYQKMNRPRVAVEYFKKAARSGCFASHLQYAECMIRADRNFDVLSFLNAILEKYKNDAVSKQTILIQMAILYYSKYQDLSNAMKYFLHAIELNPTNLQLKNSFDMMKLRSYNIYDFILHKLLPEYECSAQDSTIVSREDVNRLKVLCIEQSQHNMTSTNTNTKVNKNKVNNNSRKNLSLSFSEMKL